VYLHIISLMNVNAYVMYTTNITLGYVTMCANMQAEDYLLLPFGYKFYLTFVSTTSSQTAYYNINALYSNQKASSLVYSWKNNQKCSGYTNV
jgi:hypothetical protein